ncbi:39S ribosomal protein L10, mitochondrial [Uranotaenia lowii]|uniref:39S ribosomal protein L10, mitochondrial n=1 Tax=Uranotaenia lowii TaxID=190385 RepID=UPI00247A8DF1|nr:39S ribosomal protein L10, mitochondrial [Uranotaenia lowii]
MSNLFQKALLQSRLPLVCFKRFRGKINIQRPRAPHYERARVLELVKPVYKLPDFNAPCLEENAAKAIQKVDNPYETIIAREVRNWLEHSKMVAFIHLNSIKQEDFFKVQVALHRYQMKVKMYSKSVIKLAVDGTKFEAIKPLFDTKTVLIFCPDESKIKQLLNVLKKTPQFILIAGIAHGRFMSKNEFVDFASMPDLTTTRAQLAAVLDSAGAKVVSDLESHQNQIVGMLEAYMRQQDEGSSDKS